MILITAKTTKLRRAREENYLQWRFEYFYRAFKIQCEFAKKKKKKTEKCIEDDQQSFVEPRPVRGEKRLTRNSDRRDVIVADGPAVNLYNAQTCGTNPNSLISRRGFWKLRTDINNSDAPAIRAMSRAGFAFIMHSCRATGRVHTPYRLRPHTEVTHDSQVMIIWIITRRTWYYTTGWAGEEKWVFRAAQ